MKLSDIDQILLTFNPTKNRIEVSESKKDEETYVTYNRNNRGLTLWIKLPIKDINVNTIYDDVSDLIGPEIDSVEDLIPRFEKLEEHGLVYDSLYYSIDNPKEGEYKDKVVFQLEQECDRPWPFEIVRHLHFFKLESLSDDLKDLREYSKDIKISTHNEPCVEGLSMGEAAEKALNLFEAVAKKYDFKKYKKEGFIP